MEYRQIVAITGLPGLFQLMSTKNDGAIVKSLSDKSVKFVSARIHHLTPLESIEIYTTGDNVRLHEVFEKIKANDAEVSDINAKKDDKAAKHFFKTILPDFDESRVYTSDIKKILKWYALLKENDLLSFEYLNAPEGDGAPENDAPDNASGTPQEATETAARPAPKAKKTAAKKAAESAPEASAEKKTATKKKAAAPAEAEKPKKATARKKTTE